jgi:hypothetical protein
MSLNLPFGIQPINALSNVDARYGPWASCADALTNTAGTRVTGLTVGVNVGGSVVEYWFKDGIADGCLVEKTSGGGSGMLNWSGSTSNAIGTYMSVSGICAQPNLTFNGSSLKATGDICASTCVCSPIICSSGCVRISSAAVPMVFHQSDAGTYFRLVYDGDDIRYDFDTGAVQGNFSSHQTPLLMTRSGTTSLRYNGSPKLITTTTGVDVTGNLVTDTLQVQTGAAAGCVLVSDASGNATWQTPAGGGIAVSGTTDNAITTYINASGDICAEPNLTFDGSVLGVAGNIVFQSTAARTICMAALTTPITNPITLRGTDISYYCDDSGYVAGGAVNIIAGTGYNEDDSGVGCGCGGHVNICAGTGIVCFADTACGGNVNIYGGNASYCDGFYNEVCGGVVNIYGGVGDDDCGCVALHYGTTLRFSTTSIGTITSGVHYVTTYVCSPIVCGVTCAAAPITCGTTCVKTPKIRVNETNYVSDVNIDAHFESTNDCEAVRIYGWSGSTTTNYGLRILNKGGTTGGGNYGAHIDAYYTAGSSSGRSHGVWALAGGKTSRYNYGVIGQLLGTNDGAGIVGIAPSCGWTTTLPVGCWGGVFYGNTYTNGISCVTTCVITPVIQLTTGAATGSVLTSTSTGVGEWCAPIDVTTNLAQYDILCYNGSTITGATDIRLKTGAARCIYFNQASTTTGSALSIDGNQGASTSAGGAVTIRGGSGGSSSGTGGHTYICGGDAFGTATGGNVYICGGSAYGGGSVWICSYAGVSTGDVRLYAGTDLQVYVAPNSCVSLRYDGSEKIRTLTNGVCVTGIVYASTCGSAPDWVATSDCRLKENIIPISNALSKINQLCGVYYNLCCDEKRERNMGLIAQDVEKILPEIVSHSQPNEDDFEYGICDDKLGLKYGKLTAVLIEAIKEQQLQINKLEAEICKLKG